MDLGAGGETEMTVTGDPPDSACLKSCLRPLLIVQEGEMERRARKGCRAVLMMMPGCAAGGAKLAVWRSMVGCRHWAARAATRAGVRQG